MTEEQLAILDDYVNHKIAEMLCRTILGNEESAEVAKERAAALLVKLKK